MKSGGWALLGLAAAGAAAAAVIAAVAGRKQGDELLTDLQSGEGNGLEQVPFTGRSPHDILDAVAYVDPEHNETLQRGYLGQPNWCNRFAHLVAEHLRVPLVWGEYGTKANDMIEWLSDGNEGWFRVGSGGEAQQLALQGFFVLATYRNILPWESGHMAVVLPYSGGIRIAQAGKNNYNNAPLISGFGSIQPTYYAHA